MALSQMMQHYMQMKEKYQDCVLFYRLGDFYEMFFDDAVKVSKLLDLTLTGKDCGLEERAPMCGIPYHAADTYIAKLVALGEKVAICEQLSDPATSKGLVERDVVRVVSAGTLIEDSCLDERSNNYLTCVYATESEIALAWVDITTGEFCVTEYRKEERAEDCINQLLKLHAAEILGNEEAVRLFSGRKEMEHGVLPHISCYMPWAFAQSYAEKNLFTQFNVQSLAAYGIAGHGGAISAAGALLEYLKDSQKHALSNLSDIRYVTENQYMMLDSVAIRNLELVRTLGENKKYGSLLWLLDHTRTGMGARMLQSMVLSPLTSIDEINYRLNGVQDLFEASIVRMGLSDMLKSVKDIERLSGKISNGNRTPRDCVALHTSLSVIPSLRFQLSGFTSAVLIDVLAGLEDVKDLTDLLSSAIADEPPANLKDGGYIKAGYCKQLDEYRDIKANGKGLIASIEARERDRTGIKTLKVGFNRVFGYYIEVSKTFKDKVPYDYQRKQTLTTGERYITEELKEVEGKILTSEDCAIRLEEKLYGEIKDELLQNIERLKRISHAVALLDCLVSLATVAKERKYTRPELLDADAPLEIVEGRHPVVEVISRERFVPNDTMLDGGENRTMILTGPNMAGKSTYMRQTALIVLLAHIGSFVPAKSAKIPMVDRIFTRVGASDNLIYDQSTFMVEMTEVAGILAHATAHSLLVLDEVGRGTSTYDGLSIAWAVVERLTSFTRAKTLFATHYHELTELEGKLEGVKNYKITVKEMNGTVLFLRKIMRGGANRSFGIEVAALAGVPKEVTERAKVILKQLEKNDIARGRAKTKEESAPVVQKSEVERILSDLDINTLSPVQALLVLSDLKEKVK